MNNLSLEQLQIPDEQLQPVTRCCECGMIIPEGQDSYECRTHRILCEYCLKMLHKRYVGVNRW